MDTQHFGAQHRQPTTDGPLRGLLSSAVHTAESFVACDRDCLLPDEAGHVRTAVASRQREFATVRCCARDALARLDAPVGAVLPRTDGPAWAKRAPQWPAGVVGSMTHCDGYYGAAVAWSTSTGGIGIDGEHNEPLPDDVRGHVLLGEEHASYLRLSELDAGVAWDRLMFSAKESVFKAWYPATGRWLDFFDCVIRPDPATATFEAVLGVEAPALAGVRLDRMQGRWRADERLLVTAVCLPAAA